MSLRSTGFGVQAMPAHPGDLVLFVPLLERLPADLTT